jgi:glycosyl transferase family 87
MPDSAPRSFLKTHGPRLLLALISLLMIADLVLRGLNVAFEPAKTDFSDVYAGAWLWRHGQNFYDSALATRAHEQLVRASFQIAPVYPPTAFVLLSPFTFLPWGWANFIWLLLGIASIPPTLFLLHRLRGSAGGDLQTWERKAGIETGVFTEALWTNSSSLTDS